MQAQVRMRRRAPLLAAFSGVTIAIGYFLITITTEDSDQYFLDLGNSGLLVHLTCGILILQFTDTFFRPITQPVPVLMNLHTNLLRKIIR